MQNDRDGLMFDRFIESVDQLPPCLSLGNLLRRCKEAIEQRTPEQQTSWINHHVRQSGLALYIGPYRNRDPYSQADVKRVHAYINQVLNDVIANAERRSMTTSIATMLDQIPGLHRKLRQRIITAIARKLLQERHVEYYVAIAGKSDTRQPGALVQRVFWQHIAERFPQAEPRITIEQQIDPFISETT